MPSLHYTGVRHHADTSMVLVLGLTALVFFYDSVIAVCQTWRTTNGTARGQHRDDRSKAA
ncbi:hypothetical protein ABT115_07445 [Streptomyces sp. NPDC001832]|uniref:hypothetical protein n=1 Tax=Streptomyces sp. NPDC001832 TaxID=3154527 RepID=UPI00331877CF